MTPVRVLQAAKPIRKPYMGNNRFVVGDVVVISSGLMAGRIGTLQRILPEGKCIIFTGGIQWPCIFKALRKVK